eukprot:CAMPEP_0202409458 /NCGR_PEP_ID=MMETSP1128-20130828/16944_1 /ASSEMBLY_ACC=CAM_ASM_000463 /TAXON_ID=3047 /ORGANISM="Dunaliella tertiolecta, Strain CCMP1320" /LENGTH=56 /DNA_ID=CAMNT_0049014795 /DNA_START=814 /DNA_END=980 /DNA_ORIENTATION=-
MERALSEDLGHSFGQAARNLWLIGAAQGGKEDRVLRCAGTRATLLPPAAAAAAAAA